DPREAALGIRCHSGWAASILATLIKGDVEILDRRRIELCDATTEGAKQPFHHAEAMTYERAKAFIDQCQKRTEKLALREFATLKGLEREQSIRIGGCAILWASGRPLPALKDILVSHALIHAAEGEFYRQAIVTAAEGANVPVTRIRETNLFGQASDQ